MTRTHHRQHPETRSLFTLITLSILLGLAVPAALWGQTTPPEPKLELYTGDGPMSDGILRIGENLAVGVSDAPAGHRYRLAVLDEAGATIVYRNVKTNALGNLDAKGLWLQNGVDDCEPPDFSKGPIFAGGGYLSFEGYAEAAETLRDRFFLVVLIDRTTGNWQAGELFQVRDRHDPLYYFSNHAGEHCRYFEEDQPVYLSVYRSLNGFDDIRSVFLIDKPLEKKAAEGDQVWKVGYDFEDAREDSPCNDPGGCPLFPAGSPLDSNKFPTLPETTTTHLGGSPLDEVVSGEYIAVLRLAESDDSERLACDQATIWPVRLCKGNTPCDLTDSADTWGCPPCPPGG